MTDEEERLTRLENAFVTLDELAKKVKANAQSEKARCNERFNALNDILKQLKDRTGDETSRR